MLCYGVYVMDAAWQIDCVQVFNLLPTTGHPLPSVQGGMDSLRKKPKYVLLLRILLISFVCVALYKIYGPTSHLAFNRDTFSAFYVSFNAICIKVKILCCQ